MILHRAAGRGTKRRRASIDADQADASARKRPRLVIGSRSQPQPQHQSQSPGAIGVRIVENIDAEFPEEIAAFLHRASKDRRLALLSITTCPYCIRVKNHFNRRNIPYVVFELDQDAQGKRDKSAKAALQFRMLIGKFRVGAKPNVSFPTLVTPDRAHIQGSDIIIDWVEQNWGVS